MLVIVVRTVINRLSLPILPFNSSDEWNRFDSQVYLGSHTLIYVAATVISGFISFGTLHIHTSGFEPWQWYDQVQHLTNLLTFLN